MKLVVLLDPCFRGLCLDAERVAVDLPAAARAALGRQDPNTLRIADCDRTIDVGCATKVSRCAATSSNSSAKLLYNRGGSSNGSDDKGRKDGKRGELHFEC